MAKRMTEDGRVIPRGVCADKDRDGHWRATYKGHSVRCASLDEAIAKRKELVKAGVPHPKYKEWFSANSNRSQ